MKKCYVTINAELPDYSAYNQKLSELGIEVIQTMLGGTKDPNVIKKNCADANYVIAGGEGWSKEAFASCPDLEFLVRIGTGYDAVDLYAATEQGVTVSYLPGVNAVSVAEMAVALMLDVFRRTSEISAELHAGKYLEMRLKGNMLVGKTIGILGCGNIGKNVVKLLQGFNCKFVACDIYHDEAFAEKYGVRYVSLDELYALSDVVSVHLPGIPETYHMIDQDSIAKMKDGVVIINTSRGSTLCTDDLVEAIKSKKVMGAGLDVFEGEGGELPQGDLAGLSRVVITPHVSSLTEEIMRDMLYLCLDKVIAFASGEPVSDVLNNGLQKD